jgi:hypothetical protein
VVITSDANFKSYFKIIIIVMGTYLDIGSADDGESVLKFNALVSMSFVASFSLASVDVI